MTSTPTTQPANPPICQLDDAAQAAAINGDYLITVNLPAMPLTPEERKMEFRTLLDELLATSVGKELFAMALEARRTYVKEIGDIDEAQFWNYFFAGVLQNRERTNALGMALEKARGYLRDGALDDYATLSRLTESLADALRDYATLSRLTESLADALRDYATHPEMSNLMASVTEPALKEFGRALQRVAGESEEWQFLNPFPENGSDVIFASLIGEREFDGAHPNEIDVVNPRPRILINDIPADRTVFYENGDNPQNFAFCGRKSQLIGTALKVGGVGFSAFSQSLLIHFDYALLRELNNNETIDLLKFGNKAGIIGLNRHGLFLGCSTPSRNTINTLVLGISLPMYSAFPSYRIGRSATDATDGLYFYVPPEVRTPLNFMVAVRFDGDGNSGAAFQQYSINDLDVDQTLANGVIFSADEHPALSLNVRYIADHNGHHVIHLEPANTVSTESAYDISIRYDFAIRAPRPTGYCASSLWVATNPAGGIFDPRLDCELQRRTGNTVMVELKEGSNGYIQARAMVNGIAANNGEFYDTGRTVVHSGLSALRWGDDITIGGAAVRLSRVYVIENKKSLTVAQTRQIYGNIETPGTIYYARQAPAYKLGAQLQVQDSAGEFFTVGANTGGVNLVLDENGNPKNFLTSPITSTSSNGQLNQRTIPEMATAKAIVVVVGEVDNDDNGAIVLTDDSSRTIFDPRPFHQSHSITGRLGRYTEIHYYFSFPQRDTIRLDYRTNSDGQSNGIHQIFLLR